MGDHKREGRWWNTRRVGLAIWFKSSQIFLYYEIMSTNIFFHFEAFFKGNHKSGRTHAGLNWLSGSSPLNFFPTMK